jgi:hypothetical protein
MLVYFQFMFNTIFIQLLIALSFITRSVAQPKTDAVLETILKNNNDVVFTDVLQHAEKYKCQIIYTQINRDKHNKPRFRNYYYNYDPHLYFNPASTVKLPLAFLSLEKLNAIHKRAVNKYTTVQFDSSYAGQTAAYKDSTSESGLPSIAHYIKRAFLISENDPYNRMYEFVGQQAINRSLHNKGYTDVRITRQFSGLTPEQNRHTNAVRFIDTKGSLLYAQPPAYNTDSFDFSHIIKIGKAHYNRNDSLVNEPFDFTQHNNISLEDLQEILESVLFPESVNASKRFNLTNNDYQFLYRYLSQYPSETNYPKYDTSKFYDSYVKFFFRDSSHHIPSHIRVFNKVGWSYGFMTDVAYVADFKNNVEFMLAATIYVNSDDILNDGKYDYNSISYPFFYQLGQTVYQYELKRKRDYKPNLSRFRLNYEKRSPNDKRPSLIEVDN